MKQRWLFVPILLILIIAGLTFSQWFPPLVAFVGANYDSLQGLASLIQIILWVGAGALAWFGLLRRSKVDKTTPTPASQVEDGSASVSVQERNVHVGGDAKDNVIVTGDYNRVVVSKLEVDEKSLLTSYLSHIYEDTGWLTLSGIDRKTASEAEARLNLSAVYTALLSLEGTPIEELDLSSETYNALKQANISTIENMLELLEPGERSILAIKNFGQKSLDQLKQSMRLEGLRGARNEITHERRSYSALEQLNRHNRLVLLGEPGSGKSTFVNFVTLCLAGEALNKAPGLEALTAPPPPEKISLAGDQTEPKPQPWDHGVLLPVRIILRDFAARGLPIGGQKATAKHLWDFITAELGACSLEDYAPYLRKHLLEKGGLLLLDGVDEVPEAEQRRTQIKAVIEDFASAYPNCRILVTSRTYAYQRQDWRLNGFTETALAPFSNGQIRYFIDRWYAHIALMRQLNHSDAQGRAERLKSAIFNNDRLLALAKRPLLLTLMASLHAWRGGSLPDKREELYADTVDLLLEWWESQRVVRDAKGEIVLTQPSLVEWLKVDRRKVRDLLNELAYRAHVVQPNLIGTADISEEDLVFRLMHISQNPDVKPARLVEFLTTRAGLLLQRGVGIYTFPHRTFQEYLAACYLTGDSYPDEVAKLAREAPNRWREIALLAGAKAARGGSFALWPLVDALCTGVPTEDNPVSDEWGALLAGQALLENADLQQLSFVNQNKVERIRSWQMHLLRSRVLPAIERARAGDALAQLGDQRFNPELWSLPSEPMLGFIEIPAGAFLMGSDRTKDSDALDDEQPQHGVELPTYYISRYPVTVAQFRAFVEDSSYLPRDADSLRGLDNHPIVRVSWYDALAYCRWLTEKLRQITPGKLGGAPNPVEGSFWEGLQSGRLAVKLPGEAEWEKAARGIDGSIYPWGDAFDPDKANIDETGIGNTSPVGCFPAGAGSYGVQDLSGNVWEWTRSLWEREWFKPEVGVRYPYYPYNPEDGRENLDAPQAGPRVLRGGSFSYHRWYARCAYRNRRGPGYRLDDVGFRVVVSPSVSTVLSPATPTPIPVCDD